MWWIDEWPSEQMHMARCGERAGPPKTLQVPTLSNLCEFNSETLQATSFWVVMELSLQRRDWLNHRSLVIGSTSSSSPLPRGQGWDWRFQASNTGSVLLVTSPILGWGPRSPSLSIFMDGGQTLRGTLFIPLVLLMLRMRQLFVLGAVMGIGEVQQYPSIPDLHSPDASISFQLWWSKMSPDIALPTPAENHHLFWTNLISKDENIADL